MNATENGGKRFQLCRYPWSLHTFRHPIAIHRFEGEMSYIYDWRVRVLRWDLRRWGTKEWPKSEDRRRDNEEA